MRLLLLIAIVFFALTGNVSAQSNTNSCAMPPLPVIVFNKSVFLNAKSMQMLDTVLKIAKRNPTCKLKVMGYGASSYKEQSASWDRVYSVVKYLTKKGYKKDHIIFEYGMQGSDPNTVDLMGSTEDGPAMVPVPLPCMSKHPSVRKGCKNH